jgi:hypothetical protein
MVVSRDKARDLVQNLIEVSNKVDCSDRRAVDALREKANSTSKQIFGDDSEYVQRMREVKYVPETMAASTSTAQMNVARERGVGKLAAILREMLMEILTGR